MMSLFPYIRKAFLIALVLVGALQAQEEKKRTPWDVLRDTSYTSNAAIKTYKKFPNVKLVPPHLPEGVTGKRNIVHANYGARKLHLDVFAPSHSVKSFRGVLIIHGGGWVSGERSMLVPMAHQIGSHGYVAVPVEYQLGPEALYPAAVYDVKAAIRWMRANGREYGIDTNKTAVYGCSAGGELAAFLGTTGDLKKFEGRGGHFGHSTEVQAVVDVDGLLDFMDVNSAKYDNNPRKPSAAHRWLGGSYKEIPNTPHTFSLFHPWFEKTLYYTLKFLDRTLKEEKTVGEIVGRFDYEI